MSEKFEVYVTKYALTTGIECKLVSATFSPTMVCSGAFCFHGEGREWHRTLDSAIARAEVMRKIKLATLRKSVSKLEALSFTDLQP